uniref:Pentacotripeptide-repeat region of PRORP domain-containing protein n=1 Tax=Brassica oleracea var. oleracea TaxID=109376 RepID=A0A0D2ZPW8_BRAOL
MRELGLLMKPSSFNSMFSFHSQRNMVEQFLREMEENNVAPDSLMVNKVLRIYAADSNVEAMETFRKKWSGEEGIKLERETMAAVAKAYSKAGSIEKAIEMYGGVEGSKREVYRLWNECKKKEKEKLEDGWLSLWNECMTNEKLEDYWYKTVIASLLKLDDVEGAEKVYGEWKTVGPNLDLRIPETLTVLPLKGDFEFPRFPNKPSFSTSAIYLTSFSPLSPQLLLTLAPPIPLNPSAADSTISEQTVALATVVTNVLNTSAAASSKP